MSTPRDRFLGRAVAAGKTREWAIGLWDFCDRHDLDAELVLSSDLRSSPSTVNDPKQKEKTP